MICLNKQQNELRFYSYFVIHFSYIFYVFVLQFHLFGLILLVCVCVLHITMYVILEYKWSTSITVLSNLQFFVYQFYAVCILSSPGMHIFIFNLHNYNSRGK